MIARVLTAVATLAWLATGVVAGRAVLTPSPTAATPASAPAATKPDAVDVVAIVGVAEQAAAALVRGGEEGAADMARLPRVPGLPVPQALDRASYVEDATTLSVRPDGDAWVVLVHVAALARTPDGYLPSAPVVVSVPVAAHARGFALAGSPLVTPVGDQPALTDG